MNVSQKPSQGHRIRARIMLERVIMSAGCRLVDFYVYCTMGLSFVLMVASAYSSFRSRLPARDGVVNILAVRSLLLALLQEDLVLGLEQLLLAHILVRIHSLSRLAHSIHDVP